MMYLNDAVRLDRNGKISDVLWHYVCFDNGKSLSERSEVNINEALEIAKAHSVYKCAADGEGSTVIIGKDSNGQETFTDAPGCPVNQMLKNLPSF